jgi:hypothetical protein
MLKNGVAHREGFVDDQISGSTLAAIAKATRTYMPLEYVLTG